MSHRRALPWSLWSLALLVDGPGAVPDGGFVGQFHAGGDLDDCHVTSFSFTPVGNWNP